MQKLRLCLLLLLLSATCHSTGWSIKHVVVLMLENRSFDHMLGFLKQIDPRVDGPTGKESNPLNPNNPNSRRIPLKFTAEPLIGFDPNHSFHATLMEMFGSEDPVYPPSMEGFVYENGGREGAIHCYNSTTVPTIQTLAREFAVFDQYFSSIPGPTQPNRQYVHSGTSHGWTSTPPNEVLVEGYPQRTIYNDMEEAGVSWNAYYSDFPLLTVQREARKYPGRFHTFIKFREDAKNGKLPAFSWVEPRWFDFLDWKENDQHPPSSSTNGEFLMAEVYETLRASPCWNDTLFIITYDEHGGLYDHVVPPLGAPNPDGINADNGFTFDRLGVRIPVVMVSPRIARNTVYHQPKKNYFDHASIPATMRKMFNLSETPLTAREAWAGTFEDVVTLDTPRTDCPMTMPVPNKALYKEYKRLQALEESEETVNDMLQKGATASTDEITDLQKEVLQAAWSLTGGDASSSHLQTAHDGALYVRSQVKRWLEAHQKE